MTDMPGGADSSRARDHLANERTFLAWLRTAANVMVLGLAIAKFADVSTGLGLAAGAVLVVVGAAGLFYGARRYHRVNRELESGRFVTGSGARGPMLAAAVLLAAILLALALLLAGGG